MLTRALAASLVSLAALVLVGPLGAASDARPSVSFRSAPRHVFPGKAASATVVVRPTGTTCSLTLRYAGGSSQRLPRVRATGGRVTWQWEVPATAKPGTGSMTASCGRAGSRRRPLVVVGSIIPRRISVTQRGWSARPARSRGTDLTYGVVLQNEAPDRAAVNISVLVNFVDAQNRLFGSTTARVGFVAAGSRYALGDTLSFPAEAPIAKLEVVIQVGGWTRQPAPRASVANLRIFPSDYEPSWGGSLEGELINDHPSLILESAQLSAVIFDADGNVIGGAKGGTYTSLPPGGRVFFKLTTGLRELPVEKAASALISIEARYVQPGS